MSIELKMKFNKLCTPTTKLVFPGERESEKANVRDIHVLYQYRISFAGRWAGELGAFSISFSLFFFLEHPMCNLHII